MPGTSPAPAKYPKMKRFTTSFCAFFLASTITVAAQTVGLGQTVQTMKANLDGNKQVSLVCYRNEDNGYFAQLVVKDDQDREVWHSPQVEAGKPSPWSFGKWDRGTSSIQFIGDIDQDGRSELLSPAPRADAGPIPFRVYRWEGQSFTFVRQACLVETAEGVFSWTGDVHDAKTWVNEFNGIDLDWVKVKISRRDSDKVWNGRVVLQPQGDHYKLLRWIDNKP